MSRPSLFALLLAPLAVSAAPGLASAQSAVNCGTSFTPAEYQLKIGIDDSSMYPLDPVYGHLPYRRYDNMQKHTRKLVANKFVDAVTVNFGTFETEAGWDKPPPAGRGPTSASGSEMGSLTCAAQLDTRFMSYIEKIELRRVWIADEEKGLVFGLSMFRHPMNEKVLTLIYPDGTRGTRDMTTQRQFDMAAAHVLKIRNRKIHEIEAGGFTLPLNSLNGWSEFVR